MDTLKIDIKRKPNQGLGIELLELAGGRASDDYGITIVSAVSGNAQEAGVIPGEAVKSNCWLLGGVACLMIMILATGWKQNSTWLMSCKGSKAVNGPTSPREAGLYG